MKRKVIQSSQQTHVCIWGRFRSYKLTLEGTNLISGELDTKDSVYASLLIIKTKRHRHVSSINIQATKKYCLYSSHICCFFVGFT